MEVLPRVSIVAVDQMEKMSVVIIILVPSAVGVAGQVNAWIAVDSPDCIHVVRIEYMLENLRNLLRHSLSY